MKDPRIITLQGRAIPLKGDDIDTDRIIPARFLRCVTFEGLGDQVFRDERFDEQGREKPHPFNDPHFQGANILVVNKNFGCGSSREHAPQALARWGIRAILGESFADIFAGNCAAIGVPVCTLPGDDIQALQQLLNQAPDSNLVLDLASQTVQIVSGSGTPEDQSRRLQYHIHMVETHRQKFLAGTWDTLATLLSHADRIEFLAKGLPYMKGYMP
ncbi:MAG: 3-isopropylmalate dehydratase small subunit [Termitinemataceae bacterium]